MTRPSRRHATVVSSPGTSSGRSVAGDLQQKSARSVGHLDVARRMGQVPEQRRLLVPGEAGDRGARRDARARGGAGNLTSRIDDHRQRRMRHAEQLEQFAGPCLRVQVHQHRARGIRDVGDMRAAGEVPHDPRVHRAQPQGAALRCLANRVRVGEQPFVGRGREIGIDGEPRQRSNAGTPAGLTQGLAALCRAPVLPHDRGRQRSARARIPRHRRLALVGEPDRRQRRVPGVRQRQSCGTLYATPDFRGILLDPTGPWVMRGDRDTSLTGHGSVRRHDESRGAAGALIDREDHRGA